MLFPVLPMESGTMVHSPVSVIPPPVRIPFFSVRSDRTEEGILPSASNTPVTAVRPVPAHLRHRSDCDVRFQTPA